jgi:restriction endonuclease S subunit
VVRKRDGGTRFPVYGGGGATFHVDRSNRADCVIVSRFGMSKECVRRVDGPFFLNDSGLSVSVRNPKVILQEYLDILLLGSQDRIYSLGTGTAQRNLDVSKFKSIEIPIPPLDDQKRIAAKLDQAEVNVRKFGSGLRDEASRLASFRRSAIDQLFETLESATKRLDEVCAVFTDGDWIESKDQSTTGIRLVQTGNVGDGVFKDRRDKARWIDQSTFDRLRCTEVHPGDILISRLPDPVGRACQIPDIGDRMITSVDCTIARPKAELVLSEFLVLFASSSIYYEQVRSMITGTTRDRISRKNLGSIEVPTPPMAAQSAIIEQASALDAACGNLASNIETRINRIAELRQSMLEAAFRGQL